jgi:accessory gene regulator protein AgrB
MFVGIGIGFILGLLWNGASFVAQWVLLNGVFNGAAIQSKVVCNLVGIATARSLPYNLPTYIRTNFTSFKSIPRDTA